MSPLFEIYQFIRNMLFFFTFPAVKTWFEHVKSLPGWSRMSIISEIAEVDRKRKSWIVEKQPKLTLYYHPVSPPARMILFFLLELNGLVLEKNV